MAWRLLFFSFSEHWIGAEPREKNERQNRAFFSFGFGISFADDFVLIEIPLLACMPLLIEFILSF